MKRGLDGQEGPSTAPRAKTGRNGRQGRWELNTIYIEIAGDILQDETGYRAQ